MNAVLFAVGWLLVIFAGIPAVLYLFQGGAPGLVLLIPAFVGVAMLLTRSKRLREHPTEE